MAEPIVQLPRFSLSASSVNPLSTSPQNDVHTLLESFSWRYEKPSGIQYEQQRPQGRTSRSHASNIVLARLAERAWCTNFQSSLLNIYCLLQRQHTSSSVGSSHRSYATDQISEHAAPKYGRKPIRNVTLRFRDKRGASLLCHRNRAATTDPTTVHVCEQRPHPVGTKPYFVLTIYPVHRLLKIQYIEKTASLGRQNA